MVPDPSQVLRGHQSVSRVLCVDTCAPEGFAELLTGFTRSIEP